MQKTTHINIKCSCGSVEFSPLKFGGRRFNLQTMEGINLLRQSGFEPDVLICKACYKVNFVVRSEDRHKID